jgi:hypothetical protein
MAQEYVNERILKRVVERLRKYEKKNKLPPSISQTINTSSIMQINERLISRPFWSSHSGYHLSDTSSIIGPFQELKSRLCEAA